MHGLCPGENPVVGGGVASADVEIGEQSRHRHTAGHARQLKAPVNVRICSRFSAPRMNCNVAGK